MEYIGIAGATASTCKCIIEANTRKYNPCTKKQLSANIAHAKSASQCYPLCRCSAVGVAADWEPPQRELSEYDVYRKREREREVAYISVCYLNVCPNKCTCVYCIDYFPYTSLSPVRPLSLPTSRHKAEIHLFCYSENFSARSHTHTHMADIKSMSYVRRARSLSTTSTKD